MATGVGNGSGPSTNDALQSILAAARPFLRGDLAAVDPELPSLVSVLVSAGAGECYHKHGTFLAHLLDVYRILRLWGAPDAVARCGLFHSSYSNSYVNLAIFEPDLRHMEEGSTKTTADEQDAGLELRIPPVFDRCSKVLDPGEQIAARDLYWEAICSDGKEGAESLLRRCIAKNPYVGEPWLVLAQVLLNGGGRWEEAEAAAAEGLRLVLEWGSSWDKRMSWEGWVSWGRVMRDKAKEKQWPRSAWGIINLGLVKHIHDD
ncbi:unnamed protein product [Triticum turgidum subsp. durum]|uniref:DUF6817 domain-containing protein n=1 Tax=Triticum turgidum subsp. durum TaxID=4567 RepID=A0A9R0S5R8_TRITD|nr:unnamed protein product [Triticum turgidum subsp. durum]